MRDLYPDVDQNIDNGDEIESEWEETTDEVVEQMLETFDIVVCSNCKSEYSVLSAEWVDGDCVCPNCNLTTGESHE